MKKDKSRKATRRNGGYWLESLGLESSLYDVLVFHNHDGSAYNIYVGEDYNYSNENREEEKINRFIHLNKYKHAKY